MHPQQTSSGSAIQWPQKTRELGNATLDSRRWNHFPFRDDDVVVATWAKTGTTWMQQIVSQLIFRGAEGHSLMGTAPWVDMAFAMPIEPLIAMLEAQTHRRSLKTHLPIDTLVYSPKAKYIYVGRDGRDAIWSLHNHHFNFTDQALEMMNNRPDRIGPPLERPTNDVVQYFREWLDSEEGQTDSSFWAFFDHIQGWWNYRHLPNLLIVHFNDLKRDLPGQMKRIAKFLDIEIEESLWPTLVEHCTFDYMKNKAEVLGPDGEAIFKGGSKTFINKGTNGRWRELLTSADLERYERVVRAKLTPECAHWLATGEMPMGERN
jgi:aryl sulfotransferase